MRTRAEVKQQLKQVTFRHLKKLLVENFKQRPDTCCHNREAVLDEDSDTVVYLCGHVNAEGVPRNVVCDARVAGCLAMARECPLWAPLKTKQQVKDEFNEIVQSSNRGLIAKRYPDIAALMWVMDDPNGDEVPSEQDLEAAVSAASGDEVHPAQGWWPTLKKKLGAG